MHRRALIRLGSLALAAVATAQPASSAAVKPWRTLLDGRDLKGWSLLGGANWTVKDGAAQADNGTIAAAGAAAAAADAAAAAARGPPPPRAALTDVEAGASSTALIVRPPPSSTKLPPPLPQPPPHARADAETRMLARYEAALAYKGEAVMSKCT